MTGLSWIISTASFATVAFLIYGILTYYGSRRVVRDRFKKVNSDSIPLIYREEANTFKKQFLDWISSLGKFAMDSKDDGSKVRFELIQAGFRHPKGPTIYFGLRVILAVVPAFIYILAQAMDGVVTKGNLITCFILAGAGFYLPPYGLRFLSRRRQDRIDKALPDVLDLLIVCMEAGLSLQATINRVSDEVKGICLDFYTELQITNAELRTGVNREVALKSLGERTGVQNLKALVGLMIQSDRMGASIVQSLRTHAAFLRVQRAQKAEEKAAKLPVKILFPMLLFIFPAIFIVVLGPAAIKISKTSFFGGH
ncbi:MAG: type II secretion system F family protein [Desulfobaccales bacterium]